MAAHGKVLSQRSGKRAGMNRFQVRGPHPVFPKISLAHLSISGYFPDMARKSRTSIDHDELHKQLLAHFLQQFLEGFLPEVAAELDFSEFDPSDILTQEVFPDLLGKPPPSLGSGGQGSPQGRWRRLPHSFHRGPRKARQGLSR